MSEIKLRKFESTDAQECAHLFYETIHSINARDYLPEQLEAWAPPVTSEIVGTFNRFLSKNISFVALIDEMIVGFSDLRDDGYYNCLFVHNNFQGQGIASQLYRKIEGAARDLDLSKLTTEASITAKPFFENKGYSVVKEQEKLHNGVFLRNYVMEKYLE